MNIFEKTDIFQDAVNGLGPLEGETLKQIRDYYRVGLTWSSNAIEGNSLSESETKVLIEDGLTVGGKPLRDTFEAIDHGKAYDFMFTLIRGREITEDAARELHRLFYRNINPDRAGVYRTENVIITGSRYPVAKPDRIPGKMRELVSWAERKRDTMHPIEFASELHIRFVFIHPFIDGNGRVARLLMNTALLQDGYLPVVIPPVLRAEYIACLEAAHRDGSDFAEFIAEREYESQKELLRLLHAPFPSLEKEGEREAR